MLRDELLCIYEMLKHVYGSHRISKVSMKSLIETTSPIAAVFFVINLFKFSPYSLGERSQDFLPYILSVVILKTGLLRGTDRLVSLTSALPSSFSFSSPPS